MRVEDLLIALAYFSIPIQLVVSISFYPRLKSMPSRVLGLVILFALFIFFCGLSHVLRCFGSTDGPSFAWINWLTAVISVATSLYLLPMTPSLLGTIDDTIDDLMVLKDRAEKSQQHMLTFMSFLCHEIRTPLFAVISNLEFLADESLTPQQNVCVSAMNQAADLMMRLVNDVLDINRLENGMLTIESVDFDLHHQLQLLHETATTNVKQRHSGNVVFQSSMAPNVPRMVRGDPTRLLQIVYNLVTNAVKFTNKGVIELNVSVETISTDPSLPKNTSQLEDTSTGRRKAGVVQLMAFGREPSNRSSTHLDNSDCVSLLQRTSTDDGYLNAAGDSSQRWVSLHIQVEDTGPGIDESRLQDIFKPFTQAKLSDYRQHGGTGLGLSIVSQLLRLMGGTIRVCSVQGKGSTFNVVLPLEVLDDNIALRPSTNITMDIPHDTFKDTPPIKQPANPITTDVEAPASRHSQLCAQPSVQSIVNESSCSSLKLNDSQDIKLPNEHCDIDSVVLIVDDNAINIKILAKIMSHFGVEYRTATNGQEAVDQVLQSREITRNPADPQFTLILMDLCMPIMGGCQAMQILRQKHDVRAPIIALTANAMDDSRAEAESAGATEFLTKPIRRDVLHRKLQQYQVLPMEA